MINDNRVNFWTGQHAKRKPRRNTIAHPFEKHMDVFEDKNVLEIGPGEGRQLGKILPVAKSYAIADICEKLLKYELYKDLDKFLITNYHEPLGKQFDVITFWYVIHHVLAEELEDFLAFLKSNLMPNGILYFNMPNKMVNCSQVANDGMKTTDHSVENVKNLLKNLGFKITLEERKYENCHCIIAKLSEEK